MQTFRTVFFQVLLLILAIVFTVAVRFAVSYGAIEAGSFTGGDTAANVTVSGIVTAMHERVSE